MTEFAHEDGKSENVITVHISELESIVKMIAHLEGSLSCLKSDLSGALRARDAEGDQISNIETNEAAQIAQHILSVRHDLRGLIGPDLVKDPGFDLLLEIYLSDARSRRLTASSAHSGTDVALTTSSRWLSRLSAAGVVIRQLDPSDRRRVWVTLDDTSFKAITRILRKRSVGA